MRGTPMEWTETRVGQLKRLWRDGHSASHIAEQLGGVTRNAVIGKAHRLGLSSRPSPIKRGTPSVSTAGERICHRSEEHTSELQSLMRISYAVFCLKKKKQKKSNKQ